MKTKNKKDIAVFVPTRLKSKRLKNKANLLIGKKKKCSMVFRLFSED